MHFFAEYFYKTNLTFTYSIILAFNKFRENEKETTVCAMSDIFQCFNNDVVPPGSKETDEYCFHYGR
jgi:hypothetical protein